MKFIFREAGSNMRKFRTNKYPLQDYFNEEVNKESTWIKVLGYGWNSVDDVLNVDIDKPQTIQEQISKIKINCQK